MKFRELTVIPNLPEKLKPLLDIAHNLWLVWDSEAFALFRDIDPDIWSATSHNPVKLLYEVPQERLNALATDDGFLFRVDNLLKKLNQYLTRPTWYEKVKNNLPEDFLIAYFSAEYGIAECLPIYSGGLGVLAGDHLKSASDLGIPFVAIGLLYSQGYFQQYLTNDGWQQEKYISYNYHVSPAQIVKTKNNQPIILEIKYPHSNVKFQIWKLSVGRINLYLLDTNIPENSPADREITYKLYGGDLEMRIKQEILLGIGGMMALDALGLNPTVTHMNEGHSAFLILERIRLLMKKNNLSFNEAKEIAAASSVFTTHTPIPAGNDRFPVDLIAKYLKEYVETNLKISFNDFIKLGKINPDDINEWFCMTVLALKLTNFCNGVSKLHGLVSRKMWQGIWPGVLLDEIPITHITNGIHANSWISREMAELFFRYLGTRWVDCPEDNEVWKKIEEIPDTELWRTHERRKERLVAFVRRRLKQQLKEKGASKEKIDSANEILSPEILTIGFARRFATYKRALLLFKDIERLKKILTNKEMPVQIIFAGKAHPKDEEGKQFIKTLYHYAEDEVLKNHIVFIENYNLNTTHYLVQGVDVWLNTPRRPLEASGTSGMKVTFNGGLNLSTVDGWWAEKPSNDCGWDIGKGEEYEDPEYQDKVEANALYELLENEIIPLYYKLGKDNLPHEWIKKMKTAMMTLCPIFNTNRMVMEYTEKFYITAGKNYFNLTNNSSEKAKKITKYKEKIAEKWKNIKILNISAEHYNSIKLGEKLKISAEIFAGGLSNNDLLVEIYYGYDRGDTLTDTQTVRAEYKSTKDNNFIYEGVITPSSSGKINYAVRILPNNEYLTCKFIPEYIIWNKE
ncbi:MAG: alpha-glucan family phosphorylase [Candidatus Goldbacteria bacterium]|nr:alpha-glucan family phosphorylase [Candidatus Goldiibacteriota bacterium]